jgi:hypothetical protein
LLPFTDARENSETDKNPSKEFKKKVSSFIPFLFKKAEGRNKTNNIYLFP